MAAWTGRMIAAHMQGMGTSKQNREPGGRPTGGRYAAAENGTPGITLGGPGPLSPVPFESRCDRDAHVVRLEAEIGALRLEAARTGMVTIASDLLKSIPELASVELTEDDSRPDRIVCGAAYDADHEPLGSHVEAKVNELVRYYDSDWYAPVLNEEFEVAAAAVWHPGKETWA